MVEPLSFNPAARDPDHDVPEHAAGDLSFRRTRDGRVREGHERAAAELIRHGFVFVRDVAHLLDYAEDADGRVSASLKDDTFRRTYPRLRRCLTLIHDIIAAWPRQWARVLRDGPQPCSRGEWVAIDDGGSSTAG